MLQLVTVKMGDYYIGFELQKVVKVIAAQAVIELNEKPEYVIGLIDYYGELIAVVNMHQRLNIATNPGIELTDKFIILETSTRKIAFKAEDISDIQQIPSECLKNSQSICPGVQFSTIVKSDDHLIYVYDSEALISSSELIDIDILIKNYQQNYAL